MGIVDGLADTRPQEKWAIDGNRFFAVRRDGGFRVKSVGGMVFQLAGSYGQLLDRDGRTKHYPHDSPGSAIPPDRLPVILGDLEIAEATWNGYVNRWQRLRMAHRCKGGFVCLFTAPRDGPGATCPRAQCRRPLPTINSTARTESMRRRARIRWDSRTESVRAPNVNPGLSGERTEVSQVSYWDVDRVRDLLDEPDEERSEDGAPVPP